MDISELIFTNLGPFLYNFIFILLWILWFIYHRERDNQKLHYFYKNYLMNNRIFYPVTGLLIVAFLYLLFSYAIKSTDVDDAITSAVQAFLKGSNPYQESVVEHHTPNGIVYSVYHYFPPDLITYSFFYLCGGFLFFPLLNTYWFIPFHFLLLIPGYWILTQIVDWPHQVSLPFFFLLITPFLFTNSMLMWFFFIIGYFFYEKRKSHTLGMTFYVLAASIKYMVGFIILFYFINDFREILRNDFLTKNWKQILHQLEPYIVSSLVLAFISLPFGLIDVIIAVFIYQGLTPFREEVAQSGGPLLIEIVQIVTLDYLYLPAAGITVILALLMLRNSPTYDQIMHFSFLAMVILPFYGTELFITLPFYWWFKEGIKGYDRNASNNKRLKQTSSLP
ncbi:MAG: hypothetical protein ACFE8U_00025 [Candidatus Hermodarchaeota archaeon]